jgi:plastocyanin
VTWLALVAVLALPQAGYHKPCRRHCRAHAVWRAAPIPVHRSTLRPAPTSTPIPIATPTPTPLPSRTGVDLDEWRVTPAYRALQAGEVEFNVANLGEDDHDFSVRDDAGTPLKTVPLAPGQSASVRVTLAAGVYTLYCSLPTHEGQGMRAKLTVR